MNKTLTVFMLLCLCLGDSYAQTGKRLVGQSQYRRKVDLRSFPLRFYDSLRYNYVGQRSSTYNYNDLQYVLNANGGYEGVTPYTGDPLWELAVTNNIDSSRFFNIAFDTVRMYINTDSPAYNLRNEFKTYNGGICTGDYYQHFSHLHLLIPDQRSVLLYSGGHLSRVISLINNPYGTANWDTTNIREFVYDVAGRMTFDTASENGMNGWSGFCSTHYTYGTGKGYLTMERRLVDSLFQTRCGRRASNEYYPDGRLKKSTKRTAISNVVDSFGYSAGIVGYSYYSQQQIDATGSLANMTITLCSHTNGAGKKDSCTVYSGNSSTPPLYSTFAIRYDAAGYADKRINYSIDTNGLYVGSYEQYYYETVYNLGTAVVPARYLCFSVAPNPTTGTLMLRSTELGLGTALSIRISNATGQLVQTETLTWPGGQLKISLGDEAVPGLYFVQVLDGNGAVLYGERVVKR